MKYLGPILVLAGLGLATAARADCSPESWQDCKGKPWVTGGLL